MWKHQGVEHRAIILWNESLTVLLLEQSSEKIPTLQNPSFGFILQSTVIPFSNESRFGFQFIGLPILKIDQTQFKLIFYSFFSPWSFLSEGSCTRVSLVADPSRLWEHRDVLAELLLAERAVGRAPHPFCHSVAEHAWACPDVILPGGHSLPWAPCPEECTVPSPQGISQGFCASLLHPSA